LALLWITRVDPNSWARVGDPGEFDWALITAIVTGAADTEAQTAGPELSGFSAHWITGPPFTE